MIWQFLEKGSMDVHVQLQQHRQSRICVVKQVVIREVILELVLQGLFHNPGMSLVASSCWSDCV